MTSPPVLLVVGGGGLLGSAVRRRAALDGFIPTQVSVPWSSPADAVAALVAATETLLTPTSGDWAVAWCAGVGTVGASPEALATEQTVLRTYLARLHDLAERSAGRGAIFVASSAGALYAGSSTPPFTEHAPIRPLSPYGEAKVAIESITTAFAESSGVPALIGRISNLYGPGQNLEKPQGIVSHLCRSNVLGHALSIYVPLDTIRDYLYVDDAARMIVHALGTLVDNRKPDPPRSIVKILASHQPTTVGSLLGEFRRVIKRRPLIALASAAGTTQPVDLRMRSTVWNELDQFASTPIASGLKSTMQDIAWRLRLRES